MQSVNGPKVRFAVGLVAAAFAWLATASAFAADAGHCHDTSDLKRFEGASIALCEYRDFAEYTLPTGKITDFDFDAKKAEIAAKVESEGRLAQLVYVIPKGPSSSEVFRNYKRELQSKGYKLLFEAKEQGIGSAQGSFFGNMGPGGQILGFSPDQARYAAAIKEGGDAKTYLGLYIVEYEDGFNPELELEKGQVVVRLDTLQVDDLKDRMTVVRASEIGTRLAASGQVSLYGILFDFNQSALKPESRPAIAEIAKFLKASPAQKLHIVGHTDNIGGFDFNIRLSQERANAVIADLVQTYGIDPSRLRGNGVGPLAPVASNAAENGRAKNRRVELVPQ